jgi:hypothetical protein
MQKFARIFGDFMSVLDRKKQRKIINNNQDGIQPISHLKVSICIQICQLWAPEESDELSIECVPGTL